MTWFETTLGDCCNLYQPQTITTKELKGDGLYPVYGANGVIGKYDKFNHVEPQLLVTCRGATCGAVNVSSAYSWINGNAMVVKPKTEELNIRFLEYFFRGAVDLSGAITGAAQPQITRQSLSPIRLTFPSLLTQLKIVEKLDAIFAEIDMATAAAKANLKNAERLFQSYLTDIFQRGGEGWLSKSIGEICTLRSGVTVSASLEKKEGEIPYLKVADMNLTMNQIAVVGSTRFLNLSDLNEKSIIPRGATIFPKRGGAIDTNKKRFVAVDVAIDLNIMSVSPKELLDPQLLFFFFLMTDMKKLGDGATIRQINNGDIEPLTINFPENMNEQVKLVDKLVALKRDVEKLTACYQNKITKLQSLRVSFLRQAFCGELVEE